MGAVSSRPCRQETLKPSEILDGQSRCLCNHPLKSVPTPIGLLGVSYVFRVLYLGLVVLRYIEHLLKNASCFKSHSESASVIG